MYYMSTRGYFIVALSFFVALVLSILPLPQLAMVFYPQWLLLVLLYWIVALPHRVGLTVAWCLGVLLDVLYGSILGEHALAFTIVAYIAAKLYRQMRVFPMVQQAFSVLLIVLLYQVILLWIQGILGQLGDVYWFWVSALSSMLLWPWIYFLLRAVRHRFRIS